MRERTVAVEDYDYVTARPRSGLLAALPHETLSSLGRHLRPVSLARGRTLCEPEEPVSCVYFVETGVVALVTVFEDGATAEMATVGREGVVGIHSLLGGVHAWWCASWSSPPARS